MEKSKTRAKEKVKKAIKGGKLLELYKKLEQFREAGLDYYHGKIKAVIHVYTEGKNEKGEKVKSKEIAEKIKKIKGVKEIYIVTGEWDLIVIAEVSSIVELAELVIGGIQSFKGVIKTVTSIVIGEVR